MEIRLNESLAKWPGEDFPQQFCREVAALAFGTLPLQRAMERGSVVLDKPPRVLVLNNQQDNRQLCVRAGVFFNSAIAGCNCADDPTPLDELEEYCELQFVIDIDTGIARVDIL